MKKITSILLTLVMVITSMTIVYAGSGASAGDPIDIATADEFRDFAAAINADPTGGAGKYYRLTDDIDFGNEPWNTFIGSEAVPFQGNLNGNGKIIKNFTVTADDDIKFGLFAYIGGSAEVYDLGIQNVTITMTNPGKYKAVAGGLTAVASGNAKFNRCFSKNIRQKLGYTWTSDKGSIDTCGGLIGDLSGDGVSVVNCYAVGADLYPNEVNYDGGLIGRGERFANVENCYTDSTLGRFKNELKDNIKNSYYVTSPDWPGTADQDFWPDAHKYYGTQISVEQLRDHQGALGTAYVKGSSANKGFPAFSWEIVSAPMTGSGTETDPYLIMSLDNLAEVSMMTETSGKYFKLGADIDLGGSLWDSYIGTEANPFKGNFNGNEKTVKNFRIMIPGPATGEESYAALFGVTDGDAVIEKLGIVNVEINSANGRYGENAGGIAALIKGNTRISNCFARGLSVTYKRKEAEINAVAPIAGTSRSDGTVIENCYSVGIDIPDSNVDYDAGILGRGDNFGKIENCYSNFSIVRCDDSFKDRVINSYYCGNLPWPWTNADGSSHYHGTAVTQAELKGMAGTLGAAFKEGGLENGGYPALSWETVSEIVLDKGEGTPDDPYLIENASQLSAVSMLTKTDGVYFKLMNDIDLNGMQWENYIGSEANPFKGDFNGNGHVISNYKIRATEMATHGLFAYTDGRAHIYNLGVENITAILPHYSWSAKFGGLIGEMRGDSSITRCYAKNVTYEAEWDVANSGRTQGEFWAAAGLVGYANGSGVEIRQCYSNYVDDGVRVMADGSTYPLADKDGGVLGIADNFLALNKCYSDTYVGRTKLGIWVEDCYQTRWPTEFDEGYDWGAWKSDVQYLGYKWNNDYYIFGDNTTYPVFKWQQYPGMYNNLVVGGSMDITDENAEKIFGVKGASIVNGINVGLASDVMCLPSTTSLQYKVPLKKNAYYRVSFMGRTTQATADGGFTFKLGDMDLSEKLIDKSLTSDWNFDTKVVYVKAAADTDAILTISGNSDLYIDNVSVTQVNPDYEVKEATESINLAHNKTEVTDTGIYVEEKICGGLEIFYTDDLGYFDGEGRMLYDKIPMGLGAIADSFHARVSIGDRDVEKSIDVNVKEREMHNIKSAVLSDASGKRVYDVKKAATLSEITLDNQSDDAATLYAVAYKNNLCVGVKTAEVTGDTCTLNWTLPQADQIRVFALADGTIKPVGIEETTYPTLDHNAKVTIYTIGDSIAATYSPEDNLKGWGQMLGAQFDENHVTVDNSFSRGGMSAEEFVRAPERLASMLPKLKKGDYVIIQLSHNDHSKYSKEKFKFLLSQLLVSVQEKGAIPVFLTSPEVLTAATDVKGADGKYEVNTQLRGYPETVKELAEERNIPVLDLYEYTHSLMREQGASALQSQEIWANKFGDNVHFTAKGATQNAQFAAKEMKNIGLPIGDFVIAK